MDKKIFFGFIVVLLVISSLLSACSGTTTSSTTATSKSTVPSATSTAQSPITQTTKSPAATSAPATTSSSSTVAHWWDKFGEPKYGGEIKIPQASAGQDMNFDNYSLIGSSDQWWLEPLFSKINWTIDRKTWSYVTPFTPEQYIVGNLAESWERPDMQSLVIHLRKGVYWQNKAPVNGREFTAYDVQTHYDRMLGTGSGYTTRAPTYTGFTPNWEKVVALDKYTVKLTFTKTTGSMGLLSIMETISLNCIEAPEWVTLGGSSVAQSTTTSANTASPLQDWHNSVGTGAWMVSDFIRGSSLTYSKNPDYWGYDERYPKNKLPYADSLKVLIIADASTRLAAMRTAKIDTMNDVPQEQLDSLIATNPDIQYTAIPGGASGVTFRVDKAPFTDIRVRTALQMSVDLGAIANKMGVDATPCGYIAPALKGFYYAYEDWPQSLKDEFAYNPTGAKKLLAEAGYPDGFTTNVITNPTKTEILQILKAYFFDVGVDMEIKVIDMMEERSYTAAGKHDQMTAGGGANSQAPTSSLASFDSTNKSLNTAFVNDPNYDAIVQELNSATSAQGIAEVMIKADKYITEHHWNVITVPSVLYYVWQPNLKGYSGEVRLTYGQGGCTFARLWVNP